MTLFSPHSHLPPSILLCPPLHCNPSLTLFYRTRMLECFIYINWSQAMLAAMLICLEGWLALLFLEIFLSYDHLFVNSPTFVFLKLFDCAFTISSDSPPWFLKAQDGVKKNVSPQHWFSHLNPVAVIIEEKWWGKKIVFLIDWLQVCSNFTAGCVMCAHMIHPN